MDHFDVIIVGLGAMGSAAALQLSKSKIRLLGLDQFAPPHKLGSSHGQSRIIREAYFEDPIYVPLVQRAYELWAELEIESGVQVFRKTGGLMISAPEEIVFKGALTSAIQHGLPHQVLNAKEVGQHFPGLKLDPEMLAVLEPRAGILFPELCVESNLKLARKNGAVLHFNERVLSWQQSGAGVTINTVNGVYHASALIISAGAWLPDLAKDLPIKLKVERQTQFWFEPLQSLFAPELCPIHLWQYDQNHFFYGFPDFGQGVKVARHHEGELAHPNTIDRETTQDDELAMRSVVERFLPSANGRLLQSIVCMYTDTPNQHFLIDRHPKFSQVIIASPCSGHGFKFSSAVGEILAEMALGITTKMDLQLFSFAQHAQ